MFYDEAMQKFREEYEKDKNTKSCLKYDDDWLITEFIPQLEDGLIQYCIVGGKYSNETNNNVGYLDHLNIDLLLSDKWLFIKR